METDTDMDGWMMLFAVFFNIFEISYSGISVVSTHLWL
jgi:hypothetical protein